MPQSKNTGFIVRNLSAFTILQSIFQQSTHPFLVNIVFDTISDALRELGFIEVLITRLHHFAILLKESVQDPNDKGNNMNQKEKELGFMVVEALALLLSHNQKML
ncbi:unnamed protein product, partial [Rotaria sp. Silwood2]